MSKHFKTAALVGLVALAGAAHAQKAGDNIVNVGAAYVTQDVSVGSVWSSNSTVQNVYLAGASAKASSETTALFSYTRMFTDNIGVELAAGIPPKIKLDITTTALGTHKDAASSEVWTPSLLAKYYFFTPADSLRPYVGLGVTYAQFKSVSVDSAMNALAGTSAKVDSAWTPVYNVGAAYKFNERWSLSGSVTYIPITTKMKITGDATTGYANSVLDVKFNSTIYGLTVGYTF